MLDAAAASSWLLPCAHRSMAAPSSSRLDDEVAALQAIYGDHFEEVAVEDARGRRVVRYHDDACAVKVSLPPTYPADGGGDERPTVTGLAFLGPECRVNAEGKVAVLREIEAIVTGNAGAETLFDVIEYLRGRSYAPTPSNDTFTIAEAAEETVFRPPTTPAPALAPAPVPTVAVISGETTTDRKSQFQAHLAFVRSLDDVAAFRYQVCVLDKRCARATHNIFAYRFTCPTTGVCHHDFDDDGEDAAGGRVAELLRLMGADGVAVIVSRWFGGILLGPDRFKLINNAARRLLEDHGVGTKKR